MKRLFPIVLFLMLGTVSTAQNYPQEWSRFTSDAYFHDIESDAAKQAALDQARTNLARQIQVRVQAVNQMDKDVVNGRSSIVYSSRQTLSTDVDMDLVESKSHFNEEDGRYYVLVYIDKTAACTYYENELKMLISNTDNTLGIAGNYRSSGFNQKAKAELEKVLKMLERTAKPFFWLNVFSLDETRMQHYLTKVQDNEQTAKQWLADLEYGTTYCVVGDADLFGQRYVKLVNEVKGELSAQGCNFVDDQAAADYVIRITASARKYNEYQGAYFTYIDAVVSIDKKASGQRIFEDEVSVKGAHTLGYNEAARDGYKKISKEISRMITQNIKQ